MIGILLFAALLTFGQEQVPVEAVPGWSTEASVGVEVAFTQHGDHPDVLLAEGIRAAQMRVDVAMYAINNPGDVDAIIDAQAACGCVRLISDRTQSGGASQRAALTKIKAAGVPVKVDAHAGIMHLKLIEVDLTTVYEGSFNATTAAATINDEVLFRIASPEIAQAVADQFDAMWNDGRRFVNW
jgi:phosphatidylserine/phosphatidylglycerophosphate/cardiolipin synthase-like enzyme